MVRKKKIKRVKDWGLDKDSEKIVRKELRKWVKEFISRADGRKGTVRKYDTIKDEYFFFTDCRDIVSGKSDASMGKRKDNVDKSLLFKDLLGELKINPIECTHCGFIGIDITNINGGFFKYCPECHNIIINTYLSNVEICIPEIIEFKEKIVKELKNNAKKR